MNESILRREMIRIIRNGGVVACDHNSIETLANTLRASLANPDTAGSVYFGVGGQEEAEAVLREVETMKRSERPMSGMLQTLLDAARGWTDKEIAAAINGVGAGRGRGR